MPKKCLICGETAEFSIKNSSDYYCKLCAVDSFGDLGLLIKIEETAKRVKKLVDEKAPQEEDENFEPEKTKA